MGDVALLEGEPQLGGFQIERLGDALAVVGVDELFEEAVDELDAVDVLPRLAARLEQRRLAVDRGLSGLDVDPVDGQVLGGEHVDGAEEPQRVFAGGDDARELGARAHGGKDERVPVLAVLADGLDGVDLLVDVANGVEVGLRPDDVVEHGADRARLVVAHEGLVALLSHCDLRVEFLRDVVVADDHVVVADAVVTGCVGRHAAS